MYQAYAFCNHSNTFFKLRASYLMFWCLDGSQESKGALIILITMPIEALSRSNATLSYQMSPFWVAWTSQKGFPLSYTSVDIALVLLNQCGFPLCYTSGHACILSPSNKKNFSNVYLARLDLHSYYPTTYKLFNLLWRADSDRATISIKHSIQLIKKACSSCRQYHLRRFIFGRAFLLRKESSTMNRQCI